MSERCPGRIDDAAEGRLQVVSLGVVLSCEHVWRSRAI